VRVTAGRAEQLPAEDGTFDAAVFCLVLCTIDEPGSALAEAARVLRLGGQIRFLEHVRSQRRVPALLQDAITPLWSRLGGGCRPNRAPPPPSALPGSRSSRSTVSDSPWPP